MKKEISNILSILKARGNQSELQTMDCKEVNILFPLQYEKFSPEGIFHFIACTMLAEFGKMVFTGKANKENIY